MKIELKRTCEDFSERRELEESPQGLELEAEGAFFEEPVKVQLTIAKSQDQLICRGRVKTGVKLECSRCLGQYHHDLSSPLDFVIDLSGNPDETKSEEEGYFVADPSCAFFEINDLVREAVILSVPFKPLCSQTCKGLCPICGTDLNRSTCNCVRQTVDPRWDQLRGLLKKKS